MKNLIALFCGGLFGIGLFISGMTDTTKRIKKPIFTDRFPEKTEQKLNRPLIIGSMMFGMGWGLSGLCPGPAMASLSFGGWQGLMFFFTMAIGMLFTPLITKYLK